ncbi:LytTR family transcriptional regulator DNA-binding domain-containing protein [Cytobacillus sp. FSL K6-0265]|uniref:LytTR family transcriptional regulator DNA-binding domain-containing protein n=1 Tax=Cytobacillus sp. FSL K6-0265 TaxID=2921448 RepID=UPI0030FD1B50
MKLLQMNQLEKTIGNTIIFPKFDLTLHRNEIVALQCHNDVGKHLIMMMIGKNHISNGQILLEDTELNKHFKSLSNRIGLSLLDDALYDRLTPREFLTFYKNLHDVNIEIDTLLQKINLIDKVNTKISKLTFSEKKRLHLGRAILHQPDLLILEEPDQNIDIESKITLQKVLEDHKKQGKVALIITNNYESALSMTDTVYRLNEHGLKKIEVMDEENGHQDIEKEELQPQQEILPIEEAGSPSSEKIQNMNNPLRLEKIPAKVDDKIILFDPTEIVYVESNDGISHLHVNGESFPCALTLNTLFERLHPFGFFRCHRSYIVNLQKVREVITWTRNSYSLILDDAKKSSIPLSKGKLNELKEIMGI